MIPRGRLSGSNLFLIALILAAAVLPAPGSQRTDDPPGGGGGTPGCPPLGTNELLTDGGFEAGTDPALPSTDWTRLPTTLCSDAMQTGPCIERIPDGAGGHVVHLLPRSSSDILALQLRQIKPGNVIERSRGYVLSFAGKTDSGSRPMTIELSLHQPGDFSADHCYTWLGAPVVTLTSSWQTFAIPFQMPEGLQIGGTPACPAQDLHLIFYGGGTGVPIQLDDISFAKEAHRPFGSGCLASFEANEYWFDGATQARIQTFDTNLIKDGSRSMALHADANRSAFAYRFVDFDLGGGLPVGSKAPGKDVTLWVYASEPKTIARLYFIARSRDVDSAQARQYEFEFASFGGFKQGWNRFIFRNAEEDFFQWWFAQQMDWNKIETIGFKLEASGNGPADVLLDFATAEDHGTSTAAPVLRQIHVESIVDNAATVAWKSWESGPAQVQCSRIAPGATLPAYDEASVSVAGPDVGSAVRYSGRLTSLLPSATYHCRITTGTQPVTQSGDFMFTTCANAACAPIPPGTPDALPVAVGGVERPVGELSPEPKASDQPLAAGSGFNVLHSGVVDACSDTVWVAEAQAELNELAALGKKGMLVAFCGSTLQTPGADAHVRARVHQLTQMANYSALAGIQFLDEPEIYPYWAANAAQAIALRQAIAEQANADGKPGLKVFSSVANFCCPVAPDASGSVCPASRYHIDCSGFVYPLSGAFDVALYDDQLVVMNPPDLPGYIVGLENHDTFAGDYWNVFQAFQWELDRRWPGTFGPSRFPTRTEMRAMAYLGFGHGAKGAYAHAQHEIARFPGTEWHWSELSEVARELSSLGPMLASTTPPPFPFQSATDPRLDNFTRGYVGDSYLVSVNTSVATLTAAGLTFAPGTPAKLVTKVAESGLAACIDSGSRFVGCNTTCLDTGSRFNDDFTPQGTHVYRLVAPPTASITSPAPNATLQGTVQVSVAAASAAPVSRVELYLDATLKGTDTTAPYQLLLDTTTALNQAHTLRAVAYDGCNAQGQQIIPVTTSNAPAPASSPNPVDGATNLPKKPTLRWTAGLNASSHKVYLGTSSNALALKATVTTPSWTSPSNLSGQTLYYWRIDEVAGNGQTTQGPVWRFTTGH